MSDETLVRWCAPTLASIKTGSLFTCGFSSEEELRGTLTRLNRCLGPKGVRALALRYRAGTGLIYVYRPAMLARDLQDDTALRLLRECGYDNVSADRLVVQLIRRLQGTGDFPHEIGLFLGYPPADVDGFIHHKAACKCCGLWKVYSDVEAARRSFDRCRRCTAAYLQRTRSGCPLQQLAVGA